MREGERAVSHMSSTSMKRAFISSIQHKIIGILQERIFN